MLRFKKEDGTNYPEWENKKLEELENDKIIELSRGRVIPKANNGIYPVYSSSTKNNGLFCYIDEFDFNEELVSWSIDGGGDIFYRPKHKFSLTNVSGFIRIKDLEYLNYKYLATILQKEHLNKKFDYQSKAHPSVIRKLYNISIPSLEEQQKIASLFSKIDEKIENQKKIISVLKKEKKGLMQKIFNQEVRFKDDEGNEFPEWETMNIGDACIVNPKTDNLDKTFFYIDLESVNAGTLSLNEPINKEDAPSRAQRVLSVDDVLFQTVRPYQMNHFHYIEKFSMQTVASTGYAQMRLINGDNRFLYQLLYTNHFNQDVNIRCTGSNYPAINSSELLKIKIKLPCIEEQRKIADFLSAFDRKIEVEKSILNDLENMKKGFMQEMF